MSATRDWGQGGHLWWPPWQKSWKEDSQSEKRAQQPRWISVSFPRLIGWFIWLSSLTGDFIDLGGRVRINLHHFVSVAFDLRNVCKVGTAFVPTLLRPDSRQASATTAYAPDAFLIRTHTFPIKINIAGIGGFQPCYHTKQSGLSASRRSQQSSKVAAYDSKRRTFYNFFLWKRYCNFFQLNFHLIPSHRNVSYKW